MPNKINKHVERLHRYLPFSPDHDQIYEEYQRTSDSLNLETQALRYLQKAAGGSARLVILTGDAGHGKTHLCRRMLQDHLGYSEDEARQLINKECDGRQPIRAKDGGSATPLRIFKDFSEHTIEEAAVRLEELGSRTGELAVVCANEGRLRAILESAAAGDVCARLSQDFRASFHDGLASRDGEMHIVNLNYQSVASRRQSSLVGSALHEWGKGTRWRICQECDSKSRCSIYRNRQMLADTDDPSSAVRRTRIESLYATVERLGTVVTIREMLMSLAYILTGGLRCSDVHERVRLGRKGWQSNHTFYNLFFVAPSSVSPEALSRIPVLQEISRLDPGMRANRNVDEPLVNRGDVFDQGQIDLEFLDPTDRSQIDGANGIDEIIGNPRNRTERRREAEFIQRVVRSLRRRAFFEDREDDGILARMGFEHGDEFEELVLGQIKPARMTALKGLMLAGLHAMQGLRMGARETNLHLVDPAFGNATFHAAIIACRIPSTNVKLLPMEKAWNFKHGQKEWAMTAAVDWLDRTVVLRLETSSGKPRNLHLDLLMFNCIARAGAGYVAKDFYAHDLRKVLNFIGRIAEQASDSGAEISGL